MSLSGVFARVVALIGAGALQWRRMQGAQPQAAWGSAPVVPEAKPQGAFPTLKMPTARGWREGQMPVAAPGLKVNAFAVELEHPRWINVLPNGDVLVAESTQVASPPRSVFHYAMQATMRRADALGVSANRITLLRDLDGDGIAEKRGTFMENLSQPFGMALVGDTFYVGNTDGVVAFPYVAGADRITTAGRKLVTFKPGGHWTRSLLPSADGNKLYAGVGSLTNIADEGMAVEEGRATIYELDLASGSNRILASGLRNAVGLAWEPATGILWTVVNERDGLGDETPPDYLTSVRDGGFYGWPYCYWGQTVDDRVDFDGDSPYPGCLTPHQGSYRALDPVRKTQNEVIAIGHFHFWQGLRVHRVVRADQFIARENVGRQRVSLIVSQRMRHLRRHGPADEIKNGGRIRPEVPDGFLRRIDADEFTVADQRILIAALAIFAVTRGAFFRENRNALRGRTAAFRQSGAVGQNADVPRRDGRFIDRLAAIGRLSQQRAAHHRQTC
jgi:glucose/arabinose dehydrogenase